MGWFWGSSNGQEDPTKKLDPELQDYLKKERPTTYTTTVKPSRETPTQPTQNPSQSTNVTTEDKPTVPAASLYPDGRYADLWKTYKPLAEVEAADNSNTAQRVIDKFKHKKDSVHAAAMENCAIEHEGLTTCFNKGDWIAMVKARATMCSDENRKFSRCYTTQAVRSPSELFIGGECANCHRNSYKPLAMPVHSNTTKKKRNAFRCTQTNYITKCSTTKAESQKPEPPDRNLPRSHLCSTRTPIQFYQVTIR